MSDIDAWLGANHEQLMVIAHAHGVPPQLVRLAAVLILAGLNDVQIDDQLAVLRARDALHVSAEGVHGAVSSIRCLTTPGSGGARADRKSAPSPL